MRVTRQNWTEHVEKMARAADKLYGDAGVRTILDAVGAACVEQYRKNLATGTENGKRFAPLSKTYAVEKQKRWGGQQILTASGAMRDGLAYAVATLGQARWRMDAGVGGTDSSGVRNGDKAEWHIEGTGRMPARDFGAMPRTLLSEIARNAFVKLHRRAYGSSAA